MALGPIELQGSVLRTQDYTQIKHQENQRTDVEQSYFQNEFRREVEDRTHQVSSKDRPDNGQKKFDAKEKGANEYHRQNDSGKKKNEVPKEGRVIQKSPSRFDISI